MRSPARYPCARPRAGQRAGLVGTNSISQNRARSASLEYIVANGGVITDAVSTQKWPGEAKVHVSLVNWIKTPNSPPTAFVLDGDPVEGITPELRTPDRSTGVEQAVGMRRAIAGRDRYIASVAQGKRLLLAWAGEWTCPSNLTYVFAFDYDYAMGVLSSSVHGAWAWSRSSTLKGDLRYTPSSVFEGFPWPYPVTDGQRERIAALSRSVIERRQEICIEGSFGLTALCNLLDEGAYTDLKALQRELDEAVAASYGWPMAVARDDDEIVRRLLGLNREIAAGERRYGPFGSQAESETAVLFAPD